MTPLLGLHEILRAAASPERAGVPGVVVLDAALDSRDAGVKRVEDRVLEPLPHQLREEPLHGIHPRRRGRGRRGTPPSGAARPSARQPSPWRRRGPPEGGWCRAACSRAFSSPHGPTSWAETSACFPAPVFAASRPPRAQRRGRAG